MLQVWCCGFEAAKRIWSRSHIMFSFLLHLFLNGTTSARRSARTLRLDAHRGCGRTQGEQRWLSDSWIFLWICLFWKRCNRSEEDTIGPLLLFMALLNELKSCRVPRANGQLKGKNEATADCVSEVRLFIIIAIQLFVCLHVFLTCSAVWRKMWFLINLAYVLRFL